MTISWSARKTASHRENEDDGRRPRRQGTGRRPYHCGGRSLWIVAVVLAATMTVSASYHARVVTRACKLALAGLSVYALDVLKHLRS